MDVVNLAHRLRRDYPIIILDNSASPLVSNIPDAVFILQREYISDIRNYIPAKPEKPKTIQQAPKKEKIKSKSVFDRIFNYFG